MSSHLVIVITSWILFCYILYHLVPSQYWSFLKGILTNPFIFLFVFGLYARSIVMDFLVSRLGEMVNETPVTAFLQDRAFLRIYRQRFGPSDFFYKLFIGLGFGAIGLLWAGGLYWFLMLPK